MRRMSWAALKILHGLFFGPVFPLYPVSYALSLALAP